MKSTLVYSFLYQSVSLFLYQYTVNKSS